jgi:hypothetical protein
MQSRLERWAPLTGVGFVILWIVGMLTTLSDSPDFVSEPAEYVKYYADHKSSIILGSVVFLWAFLLLLWFLGSLRQRLADAEGGQARVASIGFAGGAIGVALGLAAIAAMVLPALRLDNDQKLTVETATTMQDLSSALFGFAAPIGFAALLFAVTVLGLRVGAVPKWWAWISALLGVVMVIPFISWAGAFFLFPLWVLVMSILLLRSERVPAPSAG